MSLPVILLAAIAVLPSDRLAMADRLFNRGEYAAARTEYAALEGEASIAGDELLYRLAECDRALDKKQEARGEYAALLDKFPMSKYADRSRLQRALAADDAATIVAELKVLDSDRVSAETRAAALFHLGCIDSDPEKFERSVKLDPKGRYAALANFRRASIMVKSPDFAVRRKAVELLLAIAFGEDKRFADEAMYLAAVQSYSEKRYGEASSLFKRYLKTFPNGKRADDVRTLSAWSEYLVGHYADAAALCGEGKTDDFAYLLAASAFASGDDELAAKRFHTYLEAFPQGKYRANAELSLARLNFARAEKGGNNPELIENAKRAYALSNLSGDALRLAWAYEKCGKTDEARATYEDVIKDFKATDDAAEALFRMAMIDARAKKWSAVELSLAEVLASGKNLKRKPESLYWRGIAAVELGHEKEGAAFLKEALSGNLTLDENREARLILADIDLRSGKPDEAKKAYSVLVREGACERMNAARTLSVGKLLGGDEAEICAKALIASDSAEWRQAGYALLGSVEEKREKFSAAIDAYRKAMAEDAKISDIAPASLALGILESRAAEYDKAEATLSRSIELNAGNAVARGRAYLILARNSLAKGDKQQARAYATVVVSLFGDKELVGEAEKILKENPEDGK